MKTNNTTNHNAPKLVTHGVSKFFGDIRALHNIDITIFPSKISAFVGPNGAGKTTLFHVLSGDLKPDSGNIIFNGEEIAGLSPWKIARRKIGKLYQDVRVFKDMTLCENVQVALLSETEYRLTSAFSLLNDREKKHKEEALYWLEYVGLADLANDQAGKLSYGQQKLLSIARLIAHKSRLLLLDEPTAALSPVMIQKMIELIRKLVLEQNCSVALIEHNMNVVKELAHYTYFMHEGSIFCHGTQESVLENSEVRELYMGLTGSAKR